MGVNREGKNMLEWESVPWCDYYDRVIDDELVREIKPRCTKVYGGCKYCPCQVQKEILKVK